MSNFKFKMASSVLPCDGTSMKLAIVTGANQGFGYGLTNLLLAKGYEVVMACRNVEAASTAASELLKQRTSKGKAVPLKLDLADLNSVVSFVAEFEVKYANRPLTYLVLNAGAVKLSKELTKQDFEYTYGTNHIGGAALFNLLLQKTLLPSKTRVVAVGSLVHTNADIKVGSDVSGKIEEFSTVKFYSNSKFFNTGWADQIQKRYSAKGVTANSCHPGSGLFTNLGRGDASTAMRVTVSCLVTVLYPLLWVVGFAQSWHDGGVAELAACEASEGGIYFYRHYPSTPSEAAQNEGIQLWVWNETKRLLAEAAKSFNLPPEIAGDE